ncbi:hypothetical protein ACHQM5_003847 [Ranunculus cassubicifolius]
MGIKSVHHKPSFFKVAVGDFTQQLHIPASFINNFNEIVPKKLFLKVSMRYWVVSLKMLDNKLVFGKGWKTFVEDNHIEQGHFIVFRLVSELVVNVTVFDKTCCEKGRIKRNDVGEVKISSMPRFKSFKLVSPLFSTRNHCARLNGRNREVKDADSTKCIHFLSTFRKGTVQKIPRWVVRKLGDKLKNIAFLKIPGGDYYEVELKKVNRKVSIKEGWHSFVSEHSIIDGDLLIFKNNGNSCFLVLKVDFGPSDKDSCDTDEEMYDEVSEENSGQELVNACEALRNLKTSKGDTTKSADCDISLQVEEIYSSSPSNECMSASHQESTPCETCEYNQDQFKKELKGDTCGMMTISGGEEIETHEIEKGYSVQSSLVPQSCQTNQPIECDYLRPKNISDEQFTKRIANGKTYKMYYVRKRFHATQRAGRNVVMTKEGTNSPDPSFSIFMKEIRKTWTNECLVQSLLSKTDKPFYAAQGNKTGAAYCKSFLEYVKRLAEGMYGKSNSGVTIKGRKPKKLVTHTVRKSPKKLQNRQKPVDKPKQSVSSYLVFMEEFRKTYKAKYANGRLVTGVTKAGGEAWRSMSDADKAPYVGESVKRKREYYKDLKAYYKKLADGNLEDEEDSCNSRSEQNNENNHDDDNDDDDDDDDY